MTRENDASLKRLTKEIYAFKLISEAEQLGHIKNYQKFKDDYSREIIVKNNMRFILNKARRHIALNLPISDLVSEGALGLVDAIDKFNVDSGKAFLTFAGWSVTKYMGLYINEYSLDLHIPYNIINAHYNVNKITDKFYAEYGHMPSNEEIFELMDNDTSQRNIDHALIFIENIKEKHSVTNTDQFKFDDLGVSLNNEDLSDALTVLSKEEKNFILSYYGIGIMISKANLAKKYNTTIGKLKVIHDRVVDKISRKW